MDLSPQTKDKSLDALGLDDRVNTGRLSPGNIDPGSLEASSSPPRLRLAGRDSTSHRVPNPQRARGSQHRVHTMLRVGPGRRTQLQDAKALLVSLVPDYGFASPTAGCGAGPKPDRALARIVDMLGLR